MVLPTDNTKSTNFLLKQQKAQKNTKKNKFRVVRAIRWQKKKLRDIREIRWQRKNFVIFVLSVGKRKIIR